MRTNHALLESTPSFNETQLRLADLLHRDAERMREFNRLSEQSRTATLARLRRLLAIDACQPVQTFEGVCAVSVHTEQSAGTNG